VVGAFVGKNEAMKRLLLAVLIVAALACGGGGGGGSGTLEPPPPDSDPPPTNVTGGNFAVTATLQVNGCEQTTVWDGTYDVQIDSTSFSMGPWTGSWDAAKAVARGESVKNQTTTRACTVTRWTSVNITFTTSDHFVGFVVYRLRLAGDCNDRSTCTTSWVIVGDRQ